MSGAPTLHLHPGKVAASAARKAVDDHAHSEAFKSMLTTFLEAGPDGNHLPAVCVLTAFSHGVMLVAEACSMAAALHRAVEAGGDVHLFFDGLRGRRRHCLLHPVGVLAYARAQSSSFSPEDALRSLTDWVQLLGPELFKATDGDRSAQILAIQRGAECFWSGVLPRVLAADSCGVFSLSPLRPQAVARRLTGQPLMHASSSPLSVLSACASLPWEQTTEVSGLAMRQIVTIMTTGDARYLGALRRQQLQLLEPLLDEVEGDTPALFLLLVAAGFCETGTVEKSDPSHSITGRYCRELERMFGAAPELTASLPLLGPTERRAAYDELHQHALDPTDGHAALINADMHLCDALGCGPAAGRSAKPDDLPRRGSRYLSVYERAKVVSTGPSLAQTPELKVVVNAVGHIFCVKPSRPGDMQDARFEDLEIYPGRVVLNLRKRAGLKGQKTAAAEGPVEFVDSATVHALTELKRMRAAQAAMDGCPLWGRDVPESRRLYARACGILGALCKHVSGDAHEAIYSLRHGLVSDEVFDGLMLDQPHKAQAALKRASTRANHRDIETTVEKYFHRAAEVMHRYVCRAIDGLLTENSVMAWTGLTRPGLDRLLDQHGRGSHAALKAILGTQVPLGALRRITAEFPCAPSPDSPSMVRVTLEDVACSQVCTNLSFDSGEPVWASGGPIGSTFTEWEHMLLVARSGYASHYEDAVRPASLRQAKLRPIASALRRRADTESIRLGLRLWRESTRGGFIDVGDPMRLHAWLIFLVACGLPASTLVLRVDPRLRDRLEVINSVFLKVVGVIPCIDQVPEGKGRPPAYLLISSKAALPGQTTPSASTSMAGFNSLLLAACIREDLLQLTDRRNRDAEA